MFAHPPDSNATAAATAPPQAWLALVAAVERLASAETLDDIIEIVRTTARAISGADGVTFVLKEDQSCNYVEEDAVGALWKGKRFPLTDCISGWCMLHDETAVIPDIYADPRVPHDAYRPTFVKSLVIVPVKTDEPIAAIGAYWAEQRAFDGGEVLLLEALARSTSTAIATARMRETLRDSDARLGIALAAGRMGVWELDLATDALTATDQCKRCFGFPPDAVITRSDLRGAIHPDDHPAVLESFEHSVAARKGLRVQCRSIWPDGSVHWLAMRGNILIDPNGTPTRVTCVVVDVTERQEAEERLDRLQAELAHIGRLTDMVHMASAFAHEVRQPLTAANNYLSAAKRFLPPGVEAKTRVTELIDQAIGQFHRADDIIRRIRNFVNKGEGTASGEDLGQLIAEACELAQFDARSRGVTVSTDLARDLPPVHVDKVQIQQVLLNLLRNAFEAMEGVMPCDVTVRAKPAGTDGQIEISVSDTGPGLPPDVVAKLFQPFVTTKDNGMGVGLAICQSIVEGHGGKMWVRTKKSDGATFFFTLPAAENSRASSGSGSS